jgi:glucosamine 6-phosphate synthetase-like amidotransferase/phosphosugar isomerase protein
MRIANMCGIAGYSLSPAGEVDRTLAAQSLLAGIAERGADAVGYAYRGAAAAVSIRKQRSGASALLREIAIPAAATELLLHVRDYTKGHPSIEANNHPIRHGAVVGVHNGIIANDDALFAHDAIERAESRMTVDSEIIFALAGRSRGRTADALERLVGVMATAWLDEARPELILARGAGRPLWLGLGRDAAFFASTRAALELAERYLRLKLRKVELPEGTLFALVDGEVVARERFRPDRSYREAEELPPVRAPHEAVTCLAALAALAGASL